MPKSRGKISAPTQDQKPKQVVPTLRTPKEPPPYEKPTDGAWNNFLGVCPFSAGDIVYVIGPNYEINRWYVRQISLIQEVRPGTGKMLRWFASCGQRYGEYKGKSFAFNDEVPRNAYFPSRKEAEDAIKSGDCTICG